MSFFSSLNNIDIQTDAILSSSVMPSSLSSDCTCAGLLGGGEEAGAGREGLGLHA